MRAFETIANLIASLAWPSVALFALIKFRDPVFRLLERIKSAGLPGGLSIDFDERLQEARSIAEDITDNPDKGRPAYQKVPQPDANKLLIERGLRPSPSGLQFHKYKEIAKQDPVLALASLRSEIDAMVRNLADGFGIDVSSMVSASDILSRLHAKGAVYTRQYNLGRKVIELCDASIRGVSVNRTEAEAVIDIAEVLASEYLDWLGWGFPDQGHRQANY